MRTLNRISVGACVTVLLLSSCRERGDPSRSESTRASESAGGGVVSATSVTVAGPPGEPATSFPAPSRPVAGIVAPRWTNEDDRDDAGEFARVAKLADVRAGMHVADIGAGAGYYVVRLAGMVGATGVVYGEDIVSDYLRLLEERVRREGLSNVRLTRGEAHDPRLPPAAIDIAFMIHMYHEIDQPFGLLYNLATSLKPGGRLVILDLDRPTFGHGTPPALLRCELSAVGYRERSMARRTGSEEYVAVFDAPPANARPTPAAIRAKTAATPCHASSE